MAYHSPLTGTRLQDLIDRRDAQRDTDVKLVARDNPDNRHSGRPDIVRLVVPVPDRRGLRRQAGDTLK